MGRLRRVFLVTGMPRSGTTAVGRYLSLAEGVAPLHEPLNGITGLSSLKRHYEIPGTGGFRDKDLEDIVNGVKFLKLKYKKRGYDRETVARKIAAKVIGHRPRLSYLAAKLRPGVKQIAWKDPFALPLLGHPAMADIPTVVTVRSPFAISGSYKRMRWGNDVDDVAGRLRSQGEWSASSFPKSVSNEDYNASENAALLWSVLYPRAAEAALARDNIIFVDIDDVVASPMETYRRLYRFLDLKWSETVEREITSEYYAAKSGEVASPIPASNKAHDRTRDVSTVNKYWKKILSDDEIHTVHNITQGHERAISQMRNEGRLNFG